MRSAPCRARSTAGSRSEAGRRSQAAWRGTATPAEASEILRKLEVAILAESLGGVETLIEHPASMTHASLPKEEREARGITDGLVRLSVGIEDIEDLVEDFQRALA